MKNDSENILETENNLQQKLKELEEANSKLKLELEEAKKASEAKSLFLANMSHEIRTPMNGVLGYLELIEQEVYEDKEELNSFVLKTRTAAESLLDIINNILDISKIEAGRMELEELDFSFREVIDETFSMLSALAAEKNLELKFEINEKVPLIVIGDPVRLRQIFSNLISNAIKYSQEGEIFTKINLKEIDEEFVTILASVKDNGIGIPEDKQNLLFKPYSMVDKSYTRIFGGTGLGLRLCKEFVNMMNGEIWVESEEEKGSEFFFTAKFKRKNL